MERIEKKFVLNKQEFLETSQELKLKPTFPSRIVKSIYFDTNDLKYFYESEEGITPRIKVRRRGYNSKPLTNLEIKKSNNYSREKIVKKNINFNEILFKNFLIENKINHHLKEKILVTYNRAYFTCSKFSRLTFDTDIKFFSVKNNYKVPMRVNDCVLEIKVEADRNINNFIEKNINLREIRFSKYCLGIKKCLSLI